MGTRITTTDVDLAKGDLTEPEAARLGPRTLAALHLADTLTSDDPIVSPELHAELTEQFSDDQILELGAALAVASGWQRFIEAFGIRPDQWTPDMAPPERPGS